MPVSATSKRSACRRRRSAGGGHADDDLALSVNLIALPTRLTRICRSRPGRRARHGHVGRDRGRRARGPCCCGLRGQQLERRPPHVAQVEVDRFQLELAGLDLREIEDVVDDGRAAPRPDSAHGLARIALLVVERACRAADRSCRSRRSSACGFRGSCWRGTLLFALAPPPRRPPWPARAPACAR